MKQFEQLSLFDVLNNESQPSTDKLSRQVTDDAIDTAKAGKYNCYNSLMQFALEFIQRNKKWSSEDLRREFENRNPFIQVAEFRVLGSIVRELKKNNLIKFAEFGIYKNPVGHRKPINIWETV